MYFYHRLSEMASPKEMLFHILVWVKSSYLLQNVHYHTVLSLKLQLQ